VYYEFYADGVPAAHPASRAVVHRTAACTT
jgi:hypothetical protein